MRPLFSGHWGLNHDRVGGAGGPRRTLEKQKNRSRVGCGFDYAVSESGFGDESRLDGLDGDEQALGSTVRELHADALQVWAELALCDAGYVRANAPALLRLTLAVDPAALDGAFTGDCTDSGHGGLDLVKG